MIQRPFGEFIPVEVIDEDGQTRPEDSVIVALPGVPQRGDTIILQDGDISKGEFISVVVTDVALYAREATAETLSAYVHVFVSYTRTRVDLLREDWKAMQQGSE
ncbi:MAG: hypothetical protein H0V70_30305 [Ktedonobacteraceae bacterium]|jgi:hypothetical protein|nr:hypothetical protein [Ktedonobacteraceae bacterium]